MAQLPEVKQAGASPRFVPAASNRKGYPSIEDVAAFIIACADLKLPFKATAGLHHPIRAEYALTYEANSPRGVMHGFLNVFLAAAFAWRGNATVAYFCETDPKAFRFDELAHWRDRSLTVRFSNYKQHGYSSFIHSVPCSFTEPIDDPLEMGNQTG